jgi:hypothetical protein
MSESLMHGCRIIPIHSIKPANHYNIFYALSRALADITWDSIELRPARVGARAMTLLRILQRLLVASIQLLCAPANIMSRLYSFAS